MPNATGTIKFQKKIVQLKHKVENPSCQEANPSAIYKHNQGAKLSLHWNNSSMWSVQYLNILWQPNFRFSTITTTLINGYCTLLPVPVRPGQVAQSMSVQQEMTYIFLSIANHPGWDKTPLQFTLPPPPSTPYKDFVRVPWQFICIALYSCWKWVQ